MLLASKSRLKSSCVILLILVSFAGCGAPLVPSFELPNPALGNLHDPADEPSYSVDATGALVRPSIEGSAASSSSESYVTFTGVSN